MDILTVGGLLVEIMRKELDKHFDEPADFTGPYASGDVAIFADVAARLGNKVAIIGTVGDDGFGRCIVNRLKADGVDVSSIRVSPDNTTGVAFVSYFSTGARQFIFHWRYAAAGDITIEQINTNLLDDLKCLHLSGVNLSINNKVRDTIYYLNETVDPSVIVSFDPNIRPEVLSVEEIRALCEPILERCDIFFPSESEAQMFTGLSSDDEGCRNLANQGKIVVLKRGTDGSVIYTKDEVIEIPAFSVKEIDPTGAGDSFAAAFVTGYLKGLSLRKCGVLANAVGAISVTKSGPMEGAPHLSTVRDFLKDMGIDDIELDW